MADFFLSNLKSTLDNCITELDEIHSMFCRNPESDFTRNRKLSFREYIQFMLQMQSKSVSNAVNICRAYLKHDGNETESMLLIQKYLTPVIISYIQNCLTTIILHYKADKQSVFLS